MRTRLAITAAATAFAAGAVGTALLAAPSPTSSAGTSTDAVLAAAETDTTTAADGPMRKHKRLLTQEQRQQLRTTGHLTVTKDTKKHGTITLAIQLGEVTAVSPTSITLTSKDGYTHSYSITDKTKVRMRRQPADLSDVTVGAKAAVIALVTPGGDNARRIMLRPARAGTDHHPAPGEPTATNA